MISLTDNVLNRAFIYNSNLYPTYQNIQDLSNCDFEVKKTQTDVTPPVLNSITINKTSVIAGESVSITADALDDISGIKYLTVYYQTPITKKDKEVNLSLLNDEYIGQLNIEDSDESGTWKIRSIHLTDASLNNIVIYNSNLGYSLSSSKDLSNCDFEVKETHADVTPPVLNSITINKTSVIAGESVSITADALDDISGIKYLTVYYQTPITKKDKEVNLSLLNDEYIGQLNIEDSDESGTWKIRSIHLTDASLNNTVIYNSNLDYSSSSSKDLSNCDFEVKEFSTHPITLSAGKYEENNDGIKFIGTWAKHTDTKHSGGNIVYSTTKDNYFEFEFEGTGFKLAQFANASRGIANITIDGVSYTQDFYSATTKYQDVIFSKLDLTSGKHTVKVEVSGNKNTSSCNIALALDYIEIINSPTSTLPILSVGKYEETNADIKFTGTWAKHTDTKHSGGNIVYSTTKGNYFEFEFEGTGFKLAQLSNASRGIANITIDGVSYTQDFYSATTKYQDVIFSKLDLTSGKHTVKVEVSGNKNTSSCNIALALDYIEIINSPTSTVLNIKNS